MSSPHLIDRRTCLKGMGVALALPLLDSMGWAEPAKKKSVKPPVRLGFMYMPHGVIMDQFWPASPESFLTTPPPALESLRPVLDQCLLMKGISGVPISPFNGAPHALELSTWLTASLPDANRRNQIHISISADQIAANYVGPLTSLPSLELATMPQTHKENQEGLNEGYYSHCSFRSATQAVPAETNPRSVLNRLFGTPDASGQRRAPGQTTQAAALDRKMLDLVLGGARDLRRTLPQGDQHKLDEYLDGVRAVERRIAAIEFRQKEAAVSSYIGSTPNGVSYPELGFSDTHHSNTHHGFEAEKVRKVAAITAFNIAQFAYMIKRMQSIREGDGTLLDNCIMMWGSGLEDGNKHARENLPFIVAGRGGGSINTGRFLPNVRGNQGDLLTTLLGCAGVPLDRPIGIATKQITEIRA